MLFRSKLFEAGSRWREEIAKALAVARAALLLVSQDFLNSDFITREELPELLKKAEKEGLKIFWVPLRPSTVKDSPLAAFQSAVDDPSVPISRLRKAKREELFLRIYQKLSAAMTS